MFHLIMTTPKKLVLNEDVLSMIIPGELGFFEVLTNHAPIISTLKVGKLVVWDKEKKKTVYALSGGLFEMSDNQATLLADTLETKAEIDLSRAERAFEKASKVLASSQSTPDDIFLAKIAFEKAKNRIDIAREADHTIFDSELM